MLERSAEQAAAQKEAELKALEARAAAEKAATVERAAAEKAAAEDKVAMLRTRSSSFKACCFERGRPDAARPPPRSAAKVGGAEAPEHAAVRGREEVELHALRAALSAVKAEHATAAAELESAKQHAQQMEEAFKTSIEAANRYGPRMEDDRERLQQRLRRRRRRCGSSWGS